MYNLNANKKGHAWPKGARLLIMNSYAVNNNVNKSEFCLSVLPLPTWNNIINNMVAFSNEFCGENAIYIAGSYGYFAKNINSL